MDPVSQPSPPPAAEYEFSEQQDQTIRRLANAMNWVAAPLLVAGVLYLLACIAYILISFQELHALAAAILAAFGAFFFLALARWTGMAAASFSQIVETKGQDISHLMSALESLRKKYTVLGFLVKLYIALIFAAVIVAAISVVILYFTEGRT